VDGTAGRDFLERLLLDPDAISHGQKLRDFVVVDDEHRSGEGREWKVARRLLETVQRLLTDERFPPVRRLVHGLILGRLVEKAHTHSLSDQRLIELFDLFDPADPAVIAGRRKLANALY
jgi:hypothetical protein